MEIDLKKGEGYKSYYNQKTENLQVIIAEKMQDLCRLQAQRNELNAKGKSVKGNSFIEHINLILSYKYKTFLI